jgi:hypothetical protein
MCKFTVTIPESWGSDTGGFINAVYIEFLDNKGSFDGNIYAGNFFAPTPAGASVGVEGYYNVSGREINVTIDKNTSSYDCAAIENYVKTNLPQPK